MSNMCDPKSRDRAGRRSARACRKPAGYKPGFRLDRVLDCGFYPVHRETNGQTDRQTDRQTDTNAQPPWRR